MLTLSTTRRITIEAMTSPSEPPADRPNAVDAIITATFNGPSWKKPCAPFRRRAWRDSPCARVGKALGVSRTALYRHFADKSALLAAVAREGFRTLRIELQRGLGHGRARTERVRSDG